MIKINQEAFSINNKLSKDLSALSKEIFLLEQKPDAIVNLKFINDEDIKILNQKYRNKSMPTNVLSFENDDISKVSALHQPSALHFPSLSPLPQLFISFIL